MTTSIICSSQSKNIREFEGWKLVPQTLKTRKQWLRSFRKVPKEALPVARVVYPQIVKNRSGLFGPEITVLEEYSDSAIISTEPSLLFDSSQTVPYNPSARTRAYWDYEDVFLRYSRKDCWIRKTNLYSGDEIEDWLTETENPYSTSYHDRNCLTDTLVHKHINQRQIIGVKGNFLTWFVVIDLDFHGRSRAVFESQAEILLDQFHGVGTWHYQVKKEDVTGLHMIQVFDKPKKLSVVHRELRNILIKLDDKHPEIAAQAKALGMRSIADLEIYPTQKRRSEVHELDTPDNGNGVRLPLCRDRQMFLDKPLATVVHRKREVQDVVKYMRWLKDPNRQYMDKNKILGYLHYFAFESIQTQNRALVVPSRSRHGVSDQKGWKGNLRCWLYDFWIQGNAHNRPLNEHIAVLARLAAVHGYSELAITKRISFLVRALPACASSCSSRLSDGKHEKIDNVISTTARYACQDNGHQRDAKNSKEIFSAALMRWPDFDPLDTSTWGTPTERLTVTPIWTETQRQRLCAFFRKPLFVKDNALIIRFINGIVNLTLSKEKQGYGWGKEYLHKWMKDQFPEIACAKDEKRQRIIKCLESEGIIQVNIRGRTGMYCTHWTLGSQAKLALNIKDESQTQETCIDSLDCPKAVLDTSTCYSSLFSFEDFFESSCLDVTAGI